MKLMLKSMTVVVTFAGLLLCTDAALAGCGPERLGTASMKPMLYRGDNGGQMVRTDFFGPFISSGITGAVGIEVYRTRQHGS